MKRQPLILALVAATLGLSALSSFAQPHDRRASATVVVVPMQQVDDRRDDRRDDRMERRDDRFERRDDRRADRRDDRRDDRHWNSRDKRWERRDARPHFYYNARGPEFRRGAYVPYEYRRPHYVVSDYRTHRLSPPPRGHHWVQVGPDYVLMAITTGLIANIIFNR